MARQRWALIIAAGLAALAAGCGDVALDDVRWACASDRQCGSAEECRLGVCVPAGSRVTTGGLVCEPAGSEGEPAARFSVEGAGRERTLVFAAGGREARFALPDEVVSLDEGPLAACCENPCCSLRP